MAKPGWQKKIDAIITAHIADDEKVVADLQAQIDALKAGTEQPPETKPPTNSGASPAERFPGDPGEGKLLYGMSTGGGDPAKREQGFGQSVQVFRSYWQASQVDAAIAVAKRDHAAGRVPFMSFKCPASWADVAAGKQDDWLMDLLTKLKDLGFAVWLCFHHEPYDDDRNGGAAYKDMYRYIYRFRPVNVALTPILQASPFDPKAMPPGGVNVLDWYDPAALDIIGIDNYNHKSYNPDNKKRDRSPDDVLAIVDVLQAAMPGKPVAVAEWGVRTDPATKGKSAQWMKDFYDKALARGVVGLCYFDSGLNVNDGGSPWTLDDQGNERLVAFDDLLAVSLV